MHLVQSHEEFPFHIGHPALFFAHAGPTRYRKVIIPLFSTLCKRFFGKVYKKLRPLAKRPQAWYYGLAVRGVPRCVGGVLACAGRREVSTPSRLPRFMVFSLK